MNDPWDVKSVRQGDQYQSCMKLNGVPLLPPVLSKECRKEMQYYKLLAKEVEKRISILKPYVEQDEDSSEDKTDAPELPECEHIEPEKPEEVEIEYDAIINKPSSGSEDISDNSDLFSPLNDEYHYKTSHIESSKLVIDLDLPIEEREKELYNTLPKTPLRTLETDELPERDCNNYKVQKELLTEFETGRKETMQKDRSDISRLDFSLPLDSEFIALHADGPSSLSTKSFTGSLHDLHSDSARDADVPKLIRQRSYTVLKPSPQLLAHLKVQSANTGIDVHSISMSESMSNVSMQNKKRRSWDLETAKVQWSSMALELKKSSVNGAPSSHSNKNITKKTPQMSPTTTSLKLQFQDRGRKANVNPRAPKSDPIQRTKKKQSPVRHSISEKTAIKDNGKQTVSKTTVKSSPTKSSVSSKEDKLVKESTTTLISSSNDPASKVRELYEKLQQQQMLQMTSLIEKQKREQQLLQQVFEEQNNILLKQLKTVCPKSAIEAKQAWGDLEDPNRGPVSLSQLINNKPSELSDPQSPVSKTLTETSNYISRCDNVLKKSRDITNKIMTPPSKARTAAVANRNQKKTIETLSPQREVNRTRPGSPSFRNSSRRLNYETSASSDYEASGGGREYEQVSTARTNDTMADLNVTFPSDSSDECLSLMQANKAAAERSQRVISGRPNSPTRMKLNLHDTRPTNSAIKNLEETIHCSMNSICSRPPQRVGAICRTTTSEERVAASRIVACAKGFLVRRLMRTERVQGTVQTIRDALVCALQLHQDRAGIRGADVDLHRRLIQQITAACYSLHDTFIASSAAERCALIAADRSRRQALAARLPTPRSSNSRRTDVMSQSHTGAFPTRGHRPPSATLMTQSTHENFSGDKSRSRYMPSPRRQPWR